MHLESLRKRQKWETDLMMEEGPEWLQSKPISAASTSSCGASLSLTEAILSDLTNWQMDTVVSPKRKVGLPSTDKVAFYWQMFNPGFCECLLCQEKYLQLKCSKKFHFKIFKIKTSCCWWCSQLEEDQPQRWSSLKTGPMQPWFNAVIKMWRNSSFCFELKLQVTVTG